MNFQQRQVNSFSFLNISRNKKKQKPHYFFILCLHFLVLLFLHYLSNLQQYSSTCFFFFFFSISLSLLISNKVSIPKKTHICFLFLKIKIPSKKDFSHKLYKKQRFFSLFFFILNKTKILNRTSSYHPL